MKKWSLKKILKILKRNHSSKEPGGGKLFQKCHRYNSLLWILTKNTLKIKIWGLLHLCCSSAESTKHMQKDIDHFYELRIRTSVKIAVMGQRPEYAIFKLWTPYISMVTFPFCGNTKAEYCSDWINVSYSPCVNLQFRVIDDATKTPKTVLHFSKVL